ncbi:hypothetical protein KSF_089120 [Reticulibacter mediterranei]|uniref:Uncharacterized protein n=1 Tax=Reticulibacter mediterranei TaxID=2778369 RepID=A0A8J3ING0_9CHLR|nr:hypothetical protein [Reticulibacter mediterranei]GHO98864.1 hypothetical protein KSF_089120 [Reticulibacter mediterranei]
MTLCYSEGLNTVWEVQRHLIGNCSDTYERARAFFAELGRVERPVHVVVSWNDFANLTAERLCVMALRVMGCEVE